VVDDLVVLNRRATLIDFDHYRLNRWLIAGGKWKQLTSESACPDLWPGGVTVSAPAEARIWWGQPSWQDYALSALVGPWEEGTLGLCFRYLDERNYYSVRWRKAGAPVIELRRTENGEDRLLAASPVEHDGGFHRLGVRSEGARILVSVDERPILNVADTAFLHGRTGLFAENVAAGLFSDVLYRFLPGPTAITTIHKAFAAEEEMRVWSAALADWTQAPCPPVLISETGGESEPNPIEVWWHRADFFGDARIDLRMHAPPETGTEAGLILNGNARDLAGGVLARLRRAAADGNDEAVLTAELLVDGLLKESALVSWPDGPGVLSLRRIGDTILLRTGEETLLTCRVSAVSGLHRVGWYAVGIAAEPSAVNLYSDNIANYTFKKAPTDWRVGAGAWGVTNKWQCDPRWSFFSGRSDGLAVLWNKRPLRGDFTIEYYVGNMMDQSRGRRYEYAQDMNITVCADGKDLTSGYSFLFGGFGNTVTGICRRGERWAEPTGRKRLLIDTRGLHRKWYHVRVSRKGGQLELRIDDQLVVSRTDDDPLPDGYWALWTYNNGIMVARVRVTAEGIEPRVSPDLVWPGTTQALY